MAQIQLNGTNKLKIFINPAGQGKTAIDDFSQYGGYSLVFDEVAQKIYLAGNTYTFKTLTTDEYSSITTAVTNIATALNASSSGSLANKIAALETALGTINSDLDVDGITGDKNVKKALEALQTQIDGLNTEFVSISDGESTLTNTDAIKTAISTAKSEAITAAATDASSKDSTLKSTIEGSATSGKTIPVTTGTGSEATTTQETFDNHKTLGYLWDRLSDAYDRIDTLGGTDLLAVQNAIAAIKAELMDTDGDTGDLANSLIDKLSGFLNNQSSWTVNGTSNIRDIGSIISALESEISAADAKHSVVTDGVAGDATAGSTNYAVVTSATNGTTGQTTYTVQTTAALDTALSNAKTTITEVSGTDGTTNYVKVTKTAGSGSIADSYNIKSTSALDTALTNAKTAVTTVNTGATNGTTNYVKITKSTSGNDTYTVTTTKALDDALTSATNAAGQVITWEVIGSGS